VKVPVIVFSRAPVVGRVKTRLAERIGGWRAARLHLRLTRRALRTARAAGCGPVELHVTAKHAAFDFSREVFLQRGADLGERMHRALRRHRRAILIGTDCPELSPRDLRRAARLLCACRVVIGPAADGGYVLVAARAAPRAMFEGVEWGTSRVFEQTGGILRRLGVQWRALRVLRDVDRPEDLDQIAPLFLRRSATRAAITP